MGFNLEHLTNKQKEIVYQNFKKQSIEDYPYLRFPDRNSFFGDFDLSRKPSFIRRLYHTFF
jgi:hypothetical protein